MPTLLLAETCDALVALLASVGQMNTQLEIVSQLCHFYVEEFVSALKTVGSCADAAVARLAEDLRREPDDPID